MPSDSTPPGENIDGYFHQGVRLARKGLWKEAIAAYKESLRLNPNRAQTYLNLGFVYYELGYEKEAQEAFERASKVGEIRGQTT